MSERKRNDVAQDLRLIPCQAGGRSYYLDAASVRSVHRKEEWRLNWRTETPLGWIQYQGEDVPILDLARALGVSHTLVAESAVVVETEAGPKAWGVGGVGRVVALPEDRVLPVPPSCWTEDSPPWLGVVTGEGTQALCVSPQYLGLGDEFPRPAAHAAILTRPSSPARITGRALLFSSYDGKGRLPDVRFCMGFGQVAEFVTAPRVVSIPSGRPWLTGLIVWRDRSVPVINLGWGVTGKAGPVETEDYLIARATAEGEFAAVPVFGPPEAVELPFECDREYHPPVTSRDWFGAAFKRKHQLILTPDFPAILAAEIK